MAQLAEHFSKVGKSLDRAVVHYNETVGSFENRVLPQARKFKELQASTSEDIEILEPLERTTRVIQGRELKTRTHLQSDTIDLFAEVAN
jgi:DNA recombination protein RmuC